MKHRFRLSNRLIAIMVILNLLACNIFASSTAEHNLFKEDQTLYSGKIIPSDAINAAFSDEIEYDSLAELKFKQTMSISGNNIAVELSLLVNSSEIKLQYIGTMYKSCRYSTEKPVYVGAFEEYGVKMNQNTAEKNTQINSFEIIYFEISNDTSPYNLNPNLRDSASLTMYLRGTDGTIYDLSREITSPVLLEDVENQAPSENDMMWFLNYFTGTHNGEQSSSSRSQYTDSWTGNYHSLRFRVANYEHLFTACPYVDFGYGDVPYSGMESFGMSLKIIESHRYKLSGAATWTSDTGEYGRCFWIDTVKLTWTAGGNTQIKYVAPHLNVKGGGSGAFNFLGLASSITGLLSQNATLDTICAVADTILGLNTGTSAAFTNTQQGGMLINTCAYSIKFPEDYYIERSGYGLDNTNAQRFEFDAFMVTGNSNVATNYWTYAVADISFVLGWANGEGDSGSQTYNVSQELGYYNNFIPQ